MSVPALAGLAVVRAERDDELLAVAAVRRTVDPDAQPSLVSMRHTLATFPHAVYLLARAGEEPVGCAYTGCFPGTEQEPFMYANVSVVPGRRRQRVGTALLQEIGRHARDVGKEGLTVEAREDDPESLAWLERRGFEEIERQKGLELLLADVAPVAPDPPDGVVVVQRAPEHERGMYDVGVEAGKDIPGLDADHDPSFEQWRSFEIERPSRRPELAFVALSGGEVVGFASADVFGESDTGWHGLTAVSRAWRGRGIATALKRSQIEAARRLGLRRLMTESEERNQPMRRLNEKLGYRPVPGMVVLRGPLPEVA
jgi:GNAT superfamily N-acetyltransferase